MQRTKKQTKKTIAEVWEEIEIQFKQNPVPIPNRTLLRWVENYCPYSFLKIQDAMEHVNSYNKNQDIYHQDFSIIIMMVNQFISYNNGGIENHFTFMGNEMQEALLKIEATLKPYPFTRRK